MSGRLSLSSLYLRLWQLRIEQHFTRAVYQAALFQLLGCGIELQMLLKQYALFLPFLRMPQARRGLW
jgi:hypothetical protein